MRVPTTPLTPEVFIERPRELDVPKPAEHGLPIPPEVPLRPAPAHRKPEVEMPPSPQRDWYVLATGARMPGPSSPISTRSHGSMLIGGPAPTAPSSSEGSHTGASSAKRAIGLGLLAGSSDPATKLIGMSLLTGLN